MANSSFYGLPRKVGSIRDAVTVLGFDTIRALVLSAGMARNFPPTPDSLFDRQAYWQHCCRVATISQSLANNLHQGQQLAYTAGMFCEIGMLVLDLCLPQQFAKILQIHTQTKTPLLELEKSELGFDHFEIGADIIRLWNFPLELELLIRHWNHTDFQDKLTPLSCLIHIAAAVELGTKDELLLKEYSQSCCAKMQITWKQIEAALPSAEKLENCFPHISESSGEPLAPPVDN
jgi:HD-like signal output (HDOD) protein